MCIGLPGRILDTGDGDFHLGRVIFGDVEKAVSLALVPDAQVGDYVLVNMGTAVHTMTEAEALEVMELLEDFAASQEERPGRSVGLAGLAPDRPHHELP